MLRKLWLPLLLLMSLSARAQETRHFTFHYGFTVKNLPAGERVRLWIPAAHSDGFQEVKVLSAQKQHHSVTLTGLTGNSTYQYNVGTGSATLATATFRTAAAAGGTFCFAAIGDFGGGGTGETQNPPHIAGARYRRSSRQWVTTFTHSPVSRIQTSPRPTRISTRDCSSRSLGSSTARRSSRRTATRSTTATAHSGATSRCRAATTAGTATTGAMRTSWCWTPSSRSPRPARNTASPRADLAAHQRAPWRIVAMQRPPYSSPSSNSSSVSGPGPTWCHCSRRARGLVLSGNSHNYERTFPLTNGPATGGITYVVTRCRRQRLQPVHHRQARVERLPQRQLLRVRQSDGVARPRSGSTADRLGDQQGHRLDHHRRQRGHHRLHRQLAAGFSGLHQRPGQAAGRQLITPSCRPDRLPAAVPRRALGRTCSSRSTDAHGQMAVGFIQYTAYQYRLYVLASPTATAATSASTVRWPDLVLARCYFLRCWRK